MPTINQLVRQGRKKIRCAVDFFPSSIKQLMNLLASKLLNWGSGD